MLFRELESLLYQQIRKSIPARYVKTSQTQGCMLSQKNYAPDPQAASGAKTLMSFLQYLQPLTKWSVSYTHLTLPTKA